MISFLIMGIFFKMIEWLLDIYRLQCYDTESVFFHFVEKYEVKLRIGALNLSVTMLQIGIIINIHNWIYYYIRIGEKSTNPITNSHIDERFIEKYLKEEVESMN